MGPRVQPAPLDKGQNGVVLLGERCGKIPRDHHVDVVLLRMHSCHKLRISRVEILIQKMLHQHPDPEAHGIGVLRPQPLPDLSKKLRFVLFKYPRRHLVACRPVVYKGQKAHQFLHAFPVLFDPRDYERVQLVLVKIPMRQVPKKFPDLFPLQHLLCQLAELRRPYADHRLRIFPGDQFGLEIPVFDVLQFKK